MVFRDSAGDCVGGLAKICDFASSCAEVESDCNERSCSLCSE